MRILSRMLVGCLALLGRGLTAQPAGAAFFTGSDLSGRAASANFTLSGTTLTVVLTNTSTLNTGGVATPCPTYALTGLFFNTTGTDTLSSAIAAKLTAGSDVINFSGTIAAGGDI